MSRARDPADASTDVSKVPASGSFTTYIGDRTTKTIFEALRKSHAKQRRLCGIRTAVP